MAILVGKIMMLKKRWQFSAKMEIFELRSAQSQSTASQGAVGALHLHPGND